jgi:hypothetical protein
MAVDYSRSAIIDIRKYLLSQISAASLFTSTVPVVPVEQTPETNDAATGPFIVYENTPTGTGGGEAYWIMKEEATFYIYSNNYADVLKLQTLLVDVFRRQDLTARDINTFSNTAPASSPINFLCCYLNSSDAPDGAKSEDGRFVGSVSIDYDYTRNVGANGRFAS